jgi:DNA-binding CsgD family transcriptional regulator
MEKTFKLTPTEREVQKLHARGKAPDVIAIRLGMKMSRVMSLIALVAKA